MRFRNRDRVCLLVVDDSADDRVACLRFLRQIAPGGYEFVEAETGGDALDRMRVIMPDCVLLDYNLPDMDGLDFLDKAPPCTSPLAFPIVMLTGQGSEEIAVEALKRGADDYVVKRQLSGETLHRAIRNAIERFELRQTIHREQAEKDDIIKELQKAVEEIKTLSGLIPICAQCKKVRDDRGYWSSVEAYIEERSSAKFSHGFCPTCYENYMEKNP